MPAPLLRRPVLTAVALLATAPLGSALAGVLRVPQEYATIQAAVEDSQPGDTVVIAKGEYAEAIVITGRSELTLVGKGKPRIRPVPSADFVAGERPPALTLSGCDGISLQGLLVERAFDGDGVCINSSLDVLLSGCTVEAAADTGADEEGDAITVNVSQDIRIERCRLLGGSGDGLSVNASVDVTVSRTLIEGLDEDGLSVNSSTAVVLERSRIDGVGEDGISVSSGSVPSDLVVARCRLSDCGEDGITVSSGATDSTLHVERSRLTDTGETAVSVSGSRSDIVLVRTLIQRTGDDGLQALGRAVTLERVTVSDTGGDAIDIEPIAGPPTFTLAGVAVEGPVLVSDCRILRAGDDGLYLEASGALVEGLKLKGAGDDGLRLGDASAMTLRQVTLSDVHRGLRLFDVDDSLFQDLRLSKLSDGVYVDFASQGNRFEELRVSAPTGDGFDIDGPDNSFTGNVVKKAGDYGFTVESAGNLFTDNVAQQSGLADLQDTSTPGANTYVANLFGTIELP